MLEENYNKIRSLPIWKNKIDIKSLDGGITNYNYLVSDGEKKNGCSIR